MNNQNFSITFIKYIFILLFAYLYMNGGFSNIFNFLNPNLKSSNPNAKYTQFLFPIKNNYTGETLSSGYFDAISFNEAIKIDKPILFFTYTPDCPVNEHVKQIIYPAAEQYSSLFTFVVMKPQGMSLSVPPKDPLNTLLFACRTSICLYDNKKKLLLSLNADLNSSQDDLIKEFEMFLEKDRKI